MASELRSTEALQSASIPELIKNLGLAVAEANQALLKSDEEAPQTKTVFAISQAEIEIKVAISMGKKTEAGGSVGASLYAFSVNAAYSKTYSYDETASSTIKLTMAAIPRRNPPSRE